jgi:uncharacterized protein YfaP (DUF2135 family)
MNKLRTGVTRTTFWILASPFILLIFTGFLTEDAEARQRNNLAHASVATLKSQMPDKKGFKVDAMHVTDTGAACIQFHIRDHVGTVSRAQAVVLGKQVAQSSASDGRFEKEWNRHCLGRAHDVTDSVELFF